MIQHDGNEGDDRLVDLQALDPADPARAGRVVGGAMQSIRAMDRSRATDESMGLLDDVARWWKPAFAAAVACVVIGVAALLLRPRLQSAEMSSASVATQVLRWAESGYVPRNDELLATFGRVSQ